MSKKTWQDRLYSYYVTSGQAGHWNPKDPEAYFAPRSSYIQTIIHSHFPHERSASVLDLGCGHGAFLFFLKKAGYANICGVDISEEQISLARQLGINEAEHAAIQPFAENIQSSSQDIVLLIDILEHLTRQDLFDLLEEVFRILRPTGKCIAHVPNAEGLFGSRVRYGDLTHELAFTPKSIHQLFSTLGFENIVCYEDKPSGASLKAHLRRLIWRVGTLGPRVLLAAETGGTSFVLSQNMLITASKPRDV